MVYVFAIIITIIALCYALYNLKRIRSMGEGTPEMGKMAGIIRSGANTFMRTEYRVIAPVIAFVAIAFSLFIEKSSGLTFILGASMSSAACVLGMRSATYANVRTTNTALRTKSIGDTVRTALRGGSISGLSVQAFGIMGLIIILWASGGVIPGATGHGFLLKMLCNPTTMRLTTYSLGCSLVAMFNRVAGGNYTKAADISADILAKVRNDLPEDSPLIPNVVADFIGDNVNDIAGNCSDLLESFVATIIAGILIAANLGKDNPELLGHLSSYPVIIAASGLISCVLGIGYALIRKKTKQTPSAQLDMATYISAGLTLILSGIAAYFLFHELPVDSFKLGWVSPWAASLLGIISGVAIGKITEYYTSTEYRPVQKLAEISPEGEAFVITKGDALGSRSCLAPIATIALSLLLASAFCGIYGIAIASLGMLSFVGTTVSIDAFGPIADNAGGIAESCELEEGVRAITDQLDAVGNTTAAIGKGFAIGSAAFATVSLIFAYVGSYATGEPILNIAGAGVVAGALVGGALIEYFSALLTDNTIESAHQMADSGSAQIDEAGVLHGKPIPEGYYNKCIELAARQALKSMLFPSVIALLVPIIGVVLFGVEFVGGILIGATIVAIPRAIFMGNSGGAFDNAKKYVEAGRVPGHGKHSAAHKAAVNGDTVGDTRKDVVGVALDIFIKMMSTVANILAPVARSFRVF